MHSSLNEEERAYLTELLFVVLANEKILPQWIDGEKVADLLVKVNGDEEIIKEMVMFIVQQRVREERIKAMKELRKKTSSTRRN